MIQRAAKQVAKAVLLHGPRGFFLAVLPATHHIQTATLAEHLKGDVRLATTDEMAELFRDCEWGVVTPFGALYGMPTFLDDGLDPGAILVFEAHSHVEAIKLRCQDYIQLERPTRLRFARKD